MTEKTAARLATARQLFVQLLIVYAAAVALAPAVWLFASIVDFLARLSR